MIALRVLASTLMIAAAFAISAAAQGSEAPAVTVVFINTAAFGGKDGITKYNKAIDVAIGEPSFALHSMRVKMEALAKEIKQMRGRPDTSAPDKLQATLDEYQNLETELRRGQEDQNASFERRKNLIMPSLLEDISRAIHEFAKEKGYSVILDAAKLDSAVVTIDVEEADVTKEFIAYYNARPATDPRR